MYSNVHVKCFFFKTLFMRCGHVHPASLAVTCNKCVVDRNLGQYRTPSGLCRSGVYQTVLSSPQSVTHRYIQVYIVQIPGRYQS